MTVWSGIGGLVGAGLLAWLYRDGYACLPKLQYALLKFATLLLPREKREASLNAWWADLLDLWPSELWRTLMALDAVRGAFFLRVQHNRQRRVMRGNAASASNVVIKFRVGWIKPSRGRTILHSINDLIQVAFVPTVSGGPPIRGTLEIGPSTHRFLRCLAKLGEGVADLKFSYLFWLAITWIALAGLVVAL